MKTSIFFSIISLFFILGCKKVEENPKYFLKVKANEVFTINTTQTIRDTIYYTITNGQVENYRILLIENYSGDCYSCDQKIKIIKQTPTFVVYEVAAAIAYSKNIESVSISLIANDNLVNREKIPVKSVKGTLITPSEDFIIYFDRYNNSIVKYNISSKTKEIIFSSASTPYYLTLSPDATMYAFNYNSTNYIYNLQGQKLYNSNGYDIQGLGFNATNNLFTYQSKYLYTYSDNLLSSSQTYFYNILIDYCSNTNYSYSIEKSSSYYYDQYYIKKGSSSLYSPSDYSSLNYISVNPQETQLLFVENYQILKSINLTTNKVTTLYSISSGYIYTPDFNAAGTKIVFELYNNSQSDIYTINADGTGVQNITNTSSYSEISPSWK